MMFCVYLECYLLKSLEGNFKRDCYGGLVPKCLFTNAHPNDRLKVTRF